MENLVVRYADDATKSRYSYFILTKAMPLGLDMVIGSVKRSYERLDPSHPAMVCLEDVLNAEGFEAILRVRDFYA